MKKLTREFFEEIIKSSKQQQDAAKESFNRHQGTIGLCEAILKNFEFDSVSQEGEKEQDNGVVNKETAGKQE